MSRSLLARGLALASFVWAHGCAAAPPRDAQVDVRSPPAATSAFPDACADRTAIDVLHHAVDLSLRFAPPSLTGRGELRLRARRATKRFALDARGLRVAEVVGVTGALPFRQDGDRLCVDVPHGVAGGTELTLRVAWSVPTAGKTPRFVSDRAWAGYEASAWMPTLQDPAQRATLALRLTTHAGLKVAASGRRAGEGPAGEGLVVHSFALERPSPPFLYGFAVGRFEEAELDVDGAGLRALGPSAPDLARALAISAPMVRFFAERTGAALPGASYLQVFVPEEGMAQEAAGFSLLAASALDDVRRDPTEDWIFAHELAHQWFGWLVPCADFADFWLNEGFATYFVAAFKEERWGRAAYEREVALWRARSAKVHAAGRDAPLSFSGPGARGHAPLTAAELQPRGVTYARGALALHKLREELGHAAFWDGVRRYVRDHAGRSARSEDLRVAFEAASGRDLKGFFARWIYRAAPDL